MYNIILFLFVFISCSLIFLIVCNSERNNNLSYSLNNHHLQSLNKSIFKNTLIYKIKNIFAACFLILCFLISILNSHRV
ncbi:preprotein translocase subunit SecG [Buchnera aphidicola]|uniref:preprotein translocase subunit SecG n=1 Tax=Buchnera aphidicola TaxID=9 RepID=UPI003464E054